MNTAHLMNELIEDVLDAPVKRKLKQKKPGVLRGTVRLAEMTADKRRAYDAERKREQRERLRAEKENGGVPLDQQSVREALADAAIAILATGSTGSDELLKVLGAIYRDKPAALGKIQHDVKHGKLRAKHLK